MMQKIRFAQFVLNEIRAQGMQRADGFLGPDYYVGFNREFSGRRYAIGTAHKDDWDLYVDGWIIKDVRLYRGPEYIKIKLTKDEREKFIQLDKQWKAKVKAKADAEKAAKKARADEGQWWP